MSGVPLFLTTYRCPAGVAAERREVTRGPFSIGRDPDNDWTLTDVGRVLSKRHCQITFNGDGWLITDISRNGTFLNGVSLDPNMPHVLRDGDKVIIGAYEIEAQLGEPPQTERGDAASLHDLRAQGLSEDRLTSDPFSLLDGDPLEAARPSVGLPFDFDPLGPEDGVTNDRGATPDHASELGAHFRAPRPSFELLPEDWDAEPTPATPNQASPESWPQAEPPASPRWVPPPSLPEPSADAVGFAAFAAGAGIAGALSGDPKSTMRALGAAFRAMVSGLRRMMMARATIKGEFRIEQTMIRAVGNNPLKFSADDDDALAALLGVGRHSGMSPEQAISEALRDMRLHELAVAAAMQHAVREVLGALEPSRVIREMRPGVFDGLFGRRRRAWESYTTLHAGMMRGLADDFDNVFGKSFVHAYEAALADIAAQDTESGV